MSFIRGRVAFLATGNVHKFHEARRVLAEFDIAVAMLNIRVEEIQEDDIEKVARASALYAARSSHLPVIVEDSGLFIRALKGFPGPYSSYIYRTIGVEGVLKLMEEINDRNAYFRSVIAFCEPRKKEPLCFHGEVYGKITTEARGSGGFGFDPIFRPRGEGKTFAEMSVEEKNRLSHRARALRKFARWYKTPPRTERK